LTLYTSAQSDLTETVPVTSLTNAPFPDSKQNAEKHQAGPRIKISRQMEKKMDVKVQVFFCFFSVKALKNFYVQS